MESSSRPLGQQQKKQRMQWLWCRGQRRRQGKLFAVPVKASTAMATEIAGVRVRTEVRDLHSAKKLNMQTVTDCMKQNEDDNETEKMWM